MAEEHSHNRFRLAIVILAVVAIIFLVAAAWVSNELVKTQAQRTNTEAQLATAQAEVAVVETELSASEELVESLEAALSNLQVNYDRLTAGYGYVLRDPSYEGMIAFLDEEDTSNQQYTESEYICVDFAAGVKANAVNEGLRCAYVIIEYRGTSGHAIVAFDTTDRGLVYVEPQHDWEVEPEIGKRYYQCVRPPPGHYVAKPGYDDTITRIIVIW